MTGFADAIQEILGPRGALARRFEGFEFRDAQTRMALLVGEAILKETPVMVEAGTGTGKTFGYLVPLVLSGKKAVVSTGTRNLQEQIFHKDIPRLRDATGLRIDAMIMKGRRNYLCLHRYRQSLSQASLSGMDPSEVREKLAAWIEKTAFGDRAELPWLADDDVLWDGLSATAEQCLGAECPFLEDCFLTKLRARASRSRIIIVNHYLFFADMKVREGGFGEVIPRFQVAVFDEAHAIEEIATAYLGETLSTAQLMDLASDIEKEIRGIRKMDAAGLKGHLSTLKAAVERLRHSLDGRADRGTVDDETLGNISRGPARDVRRGLGRVAEAAESGGPDHPALRAAALRADQMKQQLERILEKRDGDWLNWYERRKRSLVFHASPLDISGPMNELLYRRAETVILTSATLSTNGSFDYLRGRLGISRGLEGIYPSHFDFRTQALMYIPGDLPPPGAPDFAAAAAERILKILALSSGRALVLFTSYHNLNMVHHLVEGRTPFTVYRQGDAPRSVLLDAFRRDVHSVLLATGSFWQGVDVPGEALSCLVIDKLPFDSPGEPLVAARIDAIRRGGGNPFMEYQLPSAIISLKQGLGRLIRKGSDRGVLSVLDKRILTSRYGRFFLESLPDIPVTRDLGDIGKFFGREKERNNAGKLEDPLHTEG